MGIISEIYDEIVEEKDKQIKMLKKDLKWALNEAKRRKITRDYTEEDEKINKLLVKYELDKP